MKKVLVLNLTPRLGMLHYSSQFCNELSKYVQLKVALADYYNETLYNEDIQCIKVKTNPDFKSFIFNTLAFWNHITFLFKIVTFKPDIVHFIDNHPWYILYARIFKILGYTIYTTQHDPTLHSGEKSTILGKVATKVNQVLRIKSDKVFVHGEILKKEVIKKYLIDENKIVSIVHGNYNFFKDVFSKGGTAEKNTFLFFGRIVSYKGLDLLLDSLSKVKEKVPDFKLIIAGPGDVTQYKKQINIYKENIEIYNFDIKPKEAYLYFEKSEFVVLPYKDATGSGVIPVAYAFSKPVIVTDVGELSSVVKNNETGIIIEKDNVEKLAESIIFMFENREKVIEMGNNGRIYSNNELGWDNVVKKIYEFNDE